MGKINQSTAIANAERAAQQWYTRNKAKVDAGTYTAVFNTGDDDDWVDSALQESIRKAWTNKADWNGLERRASFSSGEPKFDLKFAIPGKTASCFNYHVPFKVDNSAELARAAQSKLDKETAKKFQAEQEKIKEDLEAVKKKKEEADKLEKARLARVTLAVNKAWNTFKTTKAYKTSIKEVDWKKQWVKDNGAKIK